MVEIEDVAKTYFTQAGPVPALGPIRLRVERGEFVALVGPSGCGKSTLLHIVGGFVEPSEGRVRVDGREVTRPGPDRGMVFQELALFPWRTALDNVAWPLEVKGAPRTERYRVAREYLEMVGLGGFAQAYPHQLSGGMKQRVAIARVLAMNPSVLLMDEPFGALDAQTRELLQEELQRIAHQTGKTVLFVTHDVEEAVYLADRVVVFTARPGRIKAVVDVPFSRPRDIRFKRDPEYLAIRHRVWDELREEVLRARQHQEAVRAG